MLVYCAVLVETVTSDENVVKIIIFILLVLSHHITLYYIIYYTNITSYAECDAMRCDAIRCGSGM